MFKCFYIRFKPEKYVGTIVPMPPVKSVKKKNKIQYASNAWAHLAKTFVE